MKRFAIAAVMLATLAAPSFSHAENQAYTGHIHAGLLDFGASEAANVIVEGCVSNGTADGVDGFGIRLDDADLDKAFTLTVAGPTGEEDADVNFWDESCASIVETFDEVGPEAGTIPDGARFASVILFTGVEADATLTVTR